MAQINPRSFSDAKQLGDSTYELILTNWGNRGAGQDRNNGSILYPPVVPDSSGVVPSVLAAQGTSTLIRGIPTPSIYAIAISPRSMVDRCVIQQALPQATGRVDYANSQPIQIAQPNIVLGGGALETEQELVVGAPIVGPLLGPIWVRADSAHWHTDFLQAADGSGPVPYGTSLANINGLVGQPTWVAPELRLLLYFTGQTPLPPRHRSPLRLTYVFSSVPAADTITRVIPIMGRKTVGIQVRNQSPTNAISIHATGSWHLVNDPAYDETNPEIEIDVEAELMAATPVPALSAGTFAISPPRGISYLVIKASGGAGVPADTIQVQVTATDD